MIEQVQINQMTEQGPVVIHPETTSSNVLHGDGTIDKIVTLDGVVQTNFNFIENKVVQDGLIDNRYNIDMNRNNVNPYAGYYISYSYDNLRDLNMFYIDFTGVTSGTGFYVEDYINNNNVIISIPYSNLVNRGFLVTININKILNLLEIKFQDGYTVTKNILSTYKFSFFGNSIGNYGCLGKINSFWYYSRTLTAQEIQHNFSVLNSTPAIKELHTTDSTGKTSILKLGSDEDHVEMATGRTLSEEYMGVLKTMGKEFVSDNGSPVEVNNGVNARLISAEIQGSTINNLLPTVNKNNVIPDSSFNATIENMVIYIKTASANKNCNLVGEISALEPSKKYMLKYWIYKNTLDDAFNLNTSATSLGVFCTNVDIPAGTTGIFEKEVETFPDLTGRTTLLRTMTGGSVTSGEIMYSVALFEKGQKTSNNPVPFGLSSTQAIISNNGQQYPIYEPTIQGKTRILKAPKGTQSWTEIQVDETRDTVTYDYKLESINGNLGSTGNIADYIDRSRKIKMLTTKLIDLADISSWTVSSQPSYSDFVLFSCTLPNEPTVSWSKNSGLCNAIVWEASYDLNREAMAIGSNKMLQVSFPKSKATTSSAFKVYLEQQRTNGTPVTIRYQLATPIEVLLTEEELKAYDTYKKVISLPFAEDKVTLNEDGSGTWVDVTNKIIINGSENWIIGTDTKTNTRNFMLNMPIASKGWAIADKYSVFKTSPSTTDEVGIYIDVSQPRIYLSFPKSIANDIDAFKAYLAQNNFTLEYQAEIPIVTTIDKSIMPTILTQQTNILEAGGAVKPSSFKVTVPVDRIAEQQAEIDEIKKQLGAVAALQLAQIN